MPAPKDRHPSSGNVPSPVAFVDFPVERQHVQPASHFRSTWLTSSQTALRQRGLFDAYAAGLTSEYRDDILSSIAGVWLPTQAAVVHYEACDRLALNAQEQASLGAQVVGETNRTVLGTLARLVRAGGVTPWMICEQLPRLWERTWRGGAVGCVQLGRKDARIEVVGWPCARVPYCRTAMRGVVQGLLQQFCTRVFVNEVRERCTPTNLMYKVSWV
jgi:hypothetical protein